MNPISRQLSEEHLIKVCKKGWGESACSFINHAVKSCGCVKTTAFEKAVNDRRSEGTITAMGDNCTGPPFYIPYGK